MILFRPVFGEQMDSSLKTAYLWGKGLNLGVNGLIALKKVLSSVFLWPHVDSILGQFKTKESHLKKFFFYVM